MQPARLVETIPDPEHYRDKLTDALKSYNAVAAKESGVTEKYNRDAHSDVSLMFCNLEGNQTKVAVVRPHIDYFDREVQYEGETRQVKVRVPTYDGFGPQLSYAFTTGELWEDFSDSSKRRRSLFRFPAERFLKRRQMLSIRSRAGAVTCSCIPGILFSRFNGEPLNVLDPEKGSTFLICGKYEHPTHAIVHYEFNSEDDMAEYNERIYQRSDTTVLRRGTRIDGVIDVFVLTKLRVKERPSLYRLSESSSSMSPRALYLPLLESPEEAEVMEQINYSDSETEEEILEPEEISDTEEIVELEETPEDKPRSLQEEILEAVEEQSDGLEDYDENFGDDIDDFGSEAVEVVKEEPVTETEKESETIPADSTPEPSQPSLSPLATGFVFQPAANLTHPVPFDGHSNYQIRPGWLKDGHERYLALDYQGEDQYNPGLSILLFQNQMLKELEQGYFYPVEGRFREAPAELFGLQDVAETIQYLPGILSGESGSEPDAGRFSFVLTEEGSIETDSVLVYLEVDPEHRSILERQTFKAFGNTSLTRRFSSLPPVIRTDIRHRSDVLYDAWHDLGPENSLIGYLAINLTLSERYGFLAPEAIRRYGSKRD